MSNTEWTSAEKILFRIAFLFFLLLIIPLQGDWYAHLFQVGGLGELFSLVSGYRTNFLYIPTESGKWGLVSFFGAWGPALVAAVGGAVVWTLLARRQGVKKNYEGLYYWLRVLVRYRIAFGLIAFGYLKVFPMQMPYPSIESLNTDLGDYSPYKIYWQSVGIVQGYEIFLGWLEVVVGALFFFRQTTAIGAMLTAGILYNISHANLAYDGGVHVYSAYFVLLALFLMAGYITPLWKLLIRREDTDPRYYYPAVFSGRRKKIWLILQYGFIVLFVFVSGYNRYDLHYHLKRLKEPVTAGLKGAEGYYNVTEFRLNGQILPYSPLDSVRWQHVVLEKYSTLVYQVNRPLHVDNTNGGGGLTDLSRNYELSGIAGGRQFYYYEIDTVSRSLLLQDKNIPRSYFDMYVRNFGAPLFTYDPDGGGDPVLPSNRKGNRGNGVKGNDKKQDGKKEKANSLRWEYARPSDTRVVLSGKNETGDSLYVVLDRVEKKYALTR